LFDRYHLVNVMHYSAYTGISIECNV